MVRLFTRTIYNYFVSEAVARIWMKLAYKIVLKLRDILGRGGRSRWLSSRREAEEVASLSGHCRMEVMEQVDEEMLTFSMEALMTNLVNPATGYLEVSTSTFTYSCKLTCTAPAPAPALLVPQGGSWPVIFEDESIVPVLQQVNNMLRRHLCEYVL